MVTYREVKTSRANFLDAREGGRLLIKLERDITLGDIVCLIKRNGMLELYSVYGGRTVPVENYSHYSNMARALISRTIGGSLLAMGQLWVNETAQSAAIANITLGAFNGTRFNCSTTGLCKLEALGVDTRKLDNTLTRLFLGSK